MRIGKHRYSSSNNANKANNSRLVLLNTNVMLHLDHTEKKKIMWRQILIISKIYFYTVYNLVSQKKIFCETTILFDIMSVDCL